MAQNDFPCGQCGAILQFKPGTDALVCGYCGHENPIEAEQGQAEELDYNATINGLSENAEVEERVTVRCPGCGAETTFDPDIKSDDCPFCGTSIVTDGHAHKVIKPKSLLPFKIEKRDADEAFMAWLKKRWFAPNKLKRQRRNQRPLQGVYIPFWTYDSDTLTNYTGQRGKHYYVKVGNRSQRRTRWYPVSGRVSNTFDDILVVASKSLPKKLTESLEPWDLPSLVPYKDDYLSGFRTESYQVDLAEGFTDARGQMDAVIRSSIRRDIGGDVQRIFTVNTTHRDVTFKHILLPLWISSYRFKEKAYRFLINARTGEVQGERPYSWVKIAFAVLTALAIGGAIWYAFEYYGNGG